MSHLPAKEDDYVYDIGQLRYDVRYDVSAGTIRYDPALYDPTRDPDMQRVLMREALRVGEEASRMNRLGRSSAHRLHTDTRLNLTRRFQ